MRAPASRRALSLVELVAVMALFAIVLATAAVAVSRSAVHRDAATLARTLTSTRWLAVTTGVPVALVSDGDALHRMVGGPLRCGLPPVGVPVWSSTRPLALTWPTAGLAFGPHGRPLRCDGSAVGNTTITLTGRDGSRAAVIVASLGRVRWERR